MVEPSSSTWWGTEAPMLGALPDLSRCMSHLAVHLCLFNKLVDLSVSLSAVRVTNTLVLPQGRVWEALISS